MITIYYIFYMMRSEGAGSEGEGEGEPGVADKLIFYRSVCKYHTKN